jgi:hypothetical protein
VGPDRRRDLARHLAPFDGYKPNEPVLFDGDRRPKPAYFALRDAIAARAVPFATRATALLAAWVDAANAGAVTGPPPRRRGVHTLRRGRKALVRAARLLDRSQFARACTRLGAARDALASATGTAAPELARTLATLRADLRCDEPPAS